MSEKMSEMFSLIQRAEKMEYVNESVAYDLYVKLFAEYEPQVSAPYESAIRLYEKRGELVKAHDIATRAIRMIEDDMMTAHADKFNDILKRIERKMEAKGIKPNSEKKTNKILRQVLIILGVLIVLMLITLFATPYGQVIMNPSAKDGSIGLEHEAMGVATYVTYPITDKMVQYCINGMKREESVIEAGIEVEHGVITLTMTIMEVKDEKTYSQFDGEICKQFANDFASRIGKCAAKEYEELSAPKAENLGEIYDYYDAEVVVSTIVHVDSDNKEEEVLTGSLKKGAKAFTFLLSGEEE